MSQYSIFFDTFFFVESHIKALNNSKKKEKNEDDNFKLLNHGIKTIFNYIFEIIIFLKAQKCIGC